MVMGIRFLSVDVGFLSLYSTSVHYAFLFILHCTMYTVYIYNTSRISYNHEKKKKKVEERLIILEQIHTYNSLDIRRKHGYKRIIKRTAKQN